MLKILKSAGMSVNGSRIGYTRGTVVDVPVEEKLYVGESVKVTETGTIVKWDEKVDESRPIGRVMQVTNRHAIIELQETLYELDSPEESEEDRIIRRGW